jgi:hypothetical protein
VCVRACTYRCAGHHCLTNSTRLTGCPWPEGPACSLGNFRPPQRIRPQNQRTIQSSCNAVASQAQAPRHNALPIHHRAGGGGPGGERDGGGREMVERAKQRVAQVSMIARMSLCIRARIPHTCTYAQVSMIASMSTYAQVSRIRAHTC